MGIDIEAIRKKLAGLSGGRERIKTWFPEPGEYAVRVLPWPDAADGAPFKELAFYYLGEDKHLAPAQFGKPDPIREVIDKLFATKKPADRELAKKLLPKVRAYAPIVIKSVDPKALLLWSIGRTVHQRLLSFFLDADIGDFTSLRDGYDLKVTISKPLGKKFYDTTVDAARKSSPAFADQASEAAVLKLIPRLEDQYSCKSYDELDRALKAWLSQGTPTSDSDGAEKGGAAADAAPAPKSEKSSSGDKPAAEAKKPRVMDDLDAAFADLEN